MKLRWLPPLIFVLSFVGVAVSLMLSRAFELVPDCRVFIDGCISISASGRREPAVFVFRATIIPTGMLLILTWWLSVQWLRLLAAGGRVPVFSLHLLATALLRLRPVGLSVWLPWLMLVIAVVVLGLAANSVVVAALMEDPSRVHNLTQWHGTSAFAAWYLLLGLAWHQTGLRQ